MSLVLVFEYLDSNDCGMFVLWLFDRYPNEPICFWIKFWFALQMVTSLCIDRSIDRLSFVVGKRPKTTVAAKWVTPQKANWSASQRWIHGSPVIPKLPLTLLTGQFFLNWESYAKTNLQQKYNFTISYFHIFQTFSKF
jgi:hypothetical protein